MIDVERAAVVVSTISLLIALVTFSRVKWYSTVEGTLLYVFITSSFLVSLLVALVLWRTPVQDIHDLADAAILLFTAKSVVIAVAVVRLYLGGRNAAGTS